MNAIELRDVRLALGGRIILDSVSLDIGGCEFFGVLGPNGAGKTTLMRAVLGLLPPGHGTIRVLGGLAARGNAAIGYMPQVRGAITNIRLSGWDFVASAVDGQRLGLPTLGKAGRSEDRSRAGPCRRARPGAPATGRDLGRRAPASAAGADLDRPPEIAIAR